MTENIQVGGEADEKLQSQLYIGKYANNVPSCQKTYSEIQALESLYGG